MEKKATGYYNPRYYHKTQLYQIVRKNLTEFLTAYDKRFSEPYGELRPEVEKAFSNFIKCGCPEDGFAKYECSDCDGLFIVPFSCKNWICPSCSEKRVLDWSEWLIKEVVYDMPHKFMTFTMPVEIRKYFFKNRFLIKYISKSLSDMLMYYLRKNCVKNNESNQPFYEEIQQKQKKKKSVLSDAIPGIIMVPQTFGERLNPNLHFHLLCTEYCIDRTGGFWESKLPNYFELRMVWRNKILSLLYNMKIISRKEFIKFREKYRKGFNLHISEPEKNNPEQSREHIIRNIGKYLVRTPLSESKIISYNREKNKVTIRYKKYEFDSEGKLQKAKKYGKETMDCLELIARLSIHVPRPYKHKIKYYGAYSTRFRGYFRKAGITLNKTAEGVLRKDFYQNWAQLIFKVYQDDPLKCPECGGKLKLAELISPKNAKKELRFLRYKTRYIGHKGFVRKEQYDYYINSS